ncbi:hypothetical protein [Cellulomonas triticagri]|uniref:Cell wall-binding repeat-containing protein n=1 Tax=Cellulomonas triticagri TaxID=2483352 RepID=A0A3M2J6F1_9CELL|nr:hypothetical protein [Cellulomonas triticagri]RMI07113.1 hypothetical protein EBM89_13780 [Cellulomonas triticagri]
MPAAPSAQPTRPRRRSLAGAGALVVATALVAACTGGGETEPTPTPTPVVLRSSVALPDAPTTVVPDGPAAEVALAVSGALFAQAPVAVLVADADPALVAPAATVAVALGGPVLVAGADGLADELDRLGTTDLVVLGDAADADLPDDVRTSPLDAAVVDADALADLGVVTGEAEEVAPDGLVAAVAALARPEPALLTAASDPEPTASASARATEEPGASAASGEPAGTDVSAEPSVLGASTTTVEPPQDAEAAALLVDSASDALDPAGTAVVAATARAAGVPVVDVPGGDPRATSATVERLDGVATVVAVGSTFGDPARLGPRVATAATGVQLPGGGQLVFTDHSGAPGVDRKRYVALYGTPGTPALGVLGEQDVPATIARAQQTAAQYDALTDDTVVPALEIIATVASAAPEPDSSYSRPRAIEDLRPLVEAAAEAGQYVVIDLQPGRTDFVTQAQQYADLLAYPHVGLALDPEWRLAPDQVHLRQIGSVGIDEVNATAAWLAEFTRDRHLPQKMFLLHQFSLRMITDRERLDTSHDELAVIIHADGQGSQPAKAGTWTTLHQGAPDVHWGWKNFYDEDTPMLDPAQTYQVQPVPDLVTYQ